ncbi:MAG: peptidyl-prolyl cis-trans isomerase [Oscillospiraceae bacterium]|jgi:hypothetical protein|nr:peptidyl-prolyl cis-trans isomerase [Oscillospiraceae bacterium]
MSRRLIALTVVLAVFLSACSAAPTPSPSAVVSSDVLATVGGIPLSAGELRYLTTVAVGMGIEVIDWDGMINGVPARRYILEEALSLATASYVTGMKAKELGFSLTDEEQGEIDWDIALEADYLGGREAFLEWLDSSGITEELYRFYSYEVPFLQQKMITGLFGTGSQHEPSEAQERDYYKNNYLTVSYIFISATDDYGEPLFGDSYNTQRSIADALRRQAVGGSDFAELVETHGQDYLMSLSPAGRTLPRGELNDAAEAAVNALRDGEISETVEADGGFFVLKKLPADWTWFEQNREDVWYLCAEEAFHKMLAEWCADVETTVSGTYYGQNPQDWIE